MPIFWSEEELSYLRGSYILVQIDERKLAIENDYETICGIYPAFRNISTLEEFAWARMCVCSRNFGIQVDGLKTAALVPYADMLNHLRPRETRWQYDDIRRGFTVCSMMHISTGSQVFDSYGQKCNHRFLLNYGFSVEENIESGNYCPNEVSYFGLRLYCMHLDDVILGTFLASIAYRRSNI
jgi:histone-lysine N-methyltransferase SETD3